MMRLLRPFILLALLPALLPGQNIKSQRGLLFAYNPLMHARASNGAVTVVVDRRSGRFAVERPDGTALLFTRSDGMTSFTNLRLDGRVFTNNTLNGPQTPAGTTMWPMGDAVEGGGKVVYRTRVTYFDAAVDLRQEFEPMLDQDYAFVRITTTVTNASARPVTCGNLIMMDLMLGFEDYMQVRIDSALVTRETGYAGAAVPAEWLGSGSLSATRVRARLRGAGTTPPDRFVVGRWRYDGYLGAASWDYTPSGLSLGDDAVLMQWDEGAPLDPGQSRSVVTDYGYYATLSSRMTCGVDSLRYDEGIGDYTPNPFALHADVQNTGDVDITNLQLTLDQLPAKISFAPGETAQKNYPVPLPAGQTARIVWKLLAGNFPQAARLDFTIRQSSPSKLPDTCRTSTVIPLTPVHAAALACDTAVTLILDASQTNYANNPFPAGAVLVNTGNVPLDSLYATISLPARLQLAGTPATIPVIPGTLLPGQFARVSWMLSALPDTSAERAVCTIAAAGRNNVRVSCQLQVNIPAIRALLPCVENGTGTRGTDFWFASPPNPRGDSPESLMVFMLSPQKARVTVSGPGIGMQTTVDIPPNTLGRVDLDAFFNEAQPEMVETRGVHVQSDVPISLYFANLRLHHSDATMILPTPALGTQYMAVGYNWYDPVEHFILCATEDVTRVTIVPTSSTSGGKLPGIPIYIMLNKGQSYYLWTDLGGRAGGLTGTTISSDKPIAVIGGGVSGHIPYPNPVDYDYLNPHFDQYLPLNLLGTEYVAVPFRSRLRGDTYKIVATENQTSVTINNNPPVILLQAGDTDEETITEASIIQSDKPVIVAQFSNSAAYDFPDNEYGDGSMVILSPAGKFLTCHAFPTGLAGHFDSSFVNVIVPEGVESAVSLDDNLLPDTTFHRVQNAPYLYAQLMLNPGVHFLETSDTRGIGAIVYGFEAHDAFTFNSGFLLVKKLRGGEDHAAAVGFLRNYPNPFNPSTAISFVVAPGSGGAPVRVLLTVHDAAGREVARLADGEFAPGPHLFRWDAERLPSGVYTCRLQAGDTTLQRAMILLK